MRIDQTSTLEEPNLGDGDVWKVSLQERKDFAYRQVIARRLAGPLSGLGWIVEE